MKARSSFAFGSLEHLYPSSVETDTDATAVFVCVCAQGSGTISTTAL